MTLRENPYGPGIEKLRSDEDFFRLRVGDYRVIFHIDEAQRHVLIARIDDRKEIYRLLVKK